MSNGCVHLRLPRGLQVADRDDAIIPEAWRASPGGAYPSASEPVFVTFSIQKVSRPQAEMVVHAQARPGDHV
jgi:hypothetical protein